MYNKKGEDGLCLLKVFTNKCSEKMKNLLFINLLCISLFTCQEQKSLDFQESYRAKFYGTIWELDFYANQTFRCAYQRPGEDNTIRGTYIKKGDTIQITEGYDTLNVHEFYLVDSTGMLIDLESRYDFIPASRLKTPTYQSKARQVRYPFNPSQDTVWTSGLEEVLNVVFNSKTMRNFYHLDEFPDRQLLVANYYYLSAQIQVDSLSAIFQPLSEIQADFYIAFDDISYGSNYANIQLRIPYEGVRMAFFLARENGIWQINDVFVGEN